MDLLRLFYKLIKCNPPGVHLHNNLNMQGGLHCKYLLYERVVSYHRIFFLPFYLNSIKAVDNKSFLIERIADKNLWIAKRTIMRHKTMRQVNKVGSTIEVITVPTNGMRSDDENKISLHDVRLCICERGMPWLPAPLAEQFLKISVVVIDITD